MAQAITEQAGSPQVRHDPSVTRHIFAALALRLKRGRTERELRRLDDRMLADIGLRRSDIEAAAVEAVGIPAPGPSLWAQLIERVSIARARARTARELECLPDHMLADIGVQRWQIAELAETGTAPGPLQRVRRAKSRTLASPVHALLSRVEDAVRPFVQWQITRVAAGQMARMNRETLADLGYVKGDVDWVPEAMADRQLKRPANHNESRRGVA